MVKIAMVAMKNVMVISFNPLLFVTTITKEHKVGYKIMGDDSSYSYKQKYILVS